MTWPNKIDILYARNGVNALKKVRQLTSYQLKGHVYVDTQPSTAIQKNFIFIRDICLTV